MKMATIPKLVLIGLIAFPTLATSETAKSSLGAEIEGLIGSVGELIAGGSLLLTGAATVPGALILGKGSIDTIVAIRNMIRVHNGERPGAASALGEVCGQGARLLHKDTQFAQDACDLDDIALSAVIVGPTAIYRTVTSVPLLARSAGAYGAMQIWNRTAYDTSRLADHTTIEDATVQR